MRTRFRIALRGYEVEPQSPFPLLSGAEILRILHPEGDRPAPKNEFGADAEAKRAIARLTHALVKQRRPGKEIISEARAEADRWGVASESAVAISAAIIAENVGGERHV